MSAGPGQILGSYQLTELLARGGMGEVFRARHRRLADREVAIKVMPAALAADPTFLQRFEREANNIAALNHPNILPLWDYGEQDGIPYIVMPLLNGGSLRERLRGRRLSPAETLRLLRPIAEALDYAHARGIVHRDIKPANILLDDRGHLYVADFGIAKATEAGSEALTRTGVGIGTPEYMAPEQTQGQAGPPSDAYALAIIAYEALSGRVPYSGKTPIDVAIKHATAPLPPLDGSDSSSGQQGYVVSPALGAVLRRALAKSPAERYPSVGAFVQAFADAIGEADAPTLAVAERPTQTTAPATPPPPPAHTPPLPAGSAGVVVAPPPSGLARSPVRRAAAVTLVVGLLLGAGLAAGLVIFLNASRGGSGQALGAGSSPTQTSAVSSASGGAGNSATPYPFPIDNALLASKYADALRRVPEASRADAKLHRVAVECFNPRANADCDLTYEIYSRQVDTTYRYTFSVNDTHPVVIDTIPAEDNSARTVVLKLPWENNPNWSRLLSESYGQLPAGYGGVDGFKVELISDANSLNDGSADWTLAYSDNDSGEYVGFTQRGARVVKDT